MGALYRSDHAVGLNPARRKNRVLHVLVLSPDVANHLVVHSEGRDVVVLGALDLVKLNVGSQLCQSL